MPLLSRRSTITRRTGSGPALLHVRSSSHVTGAAYSCERGGVSLNCSIYYIFLAELLRTASTRSSRAYLIYPIAPVWGPILGEAIIHPARIIRALCMSGHVPQTPYIRSPAAYVRGMQDPLSQLRKMLVPRSSTNRGQEIAEGPVTQRKQACFPSVGNPSLTLTLQWWSRSIAWLHRGSLVSIPLLTICPGYSPWRSSGDRRF
jgi:hypothetical protein